MVEITIRKRQREDAEFTQRKFFKKTARGKVVKSALLSTSFRSSADFFLVIRERYLRDDVSCGIEKCRECNSPPTLYLPFGGAVDHKAFSQGHFVLPDTNVFLSQVCLSHRRRRIIWVNRNFPLQMDVIESSHFKTPIILLQTVLEEVRHRSLPLFNRLKALMKMDEKRTWIFYNEFRS